MPQSFIANGDVFPSRFVKMDTVDGKVVQCGAGDSPYGISQKGTRRSPYIDTSAKAAIAGEPIEVYQLGERCLLELAGTVLPQAKLKSDANGKGLSTVTDKDAYGAIASFNGISGQKIEVLVEFGTISV